MIKFTSQYDKEHEKIDMEMHSDSNLGEVLEVFERFLKATGYNFDGTVDIVPLAPTDADIEAACGTNPGLTD